MNIFDLGRAVPGVLPDFLTTGLLWLVGVIVDLGVGAIKFLSGSLDGLMFGTGANTLRLFNLNYSGMNMGSYQGVATGFQVFSLVVMVLVFSYAVITKFFLNTDEQQGNRQVSVPNLIRKYFIAILMMFVGLPMMYWAVSIFNDTAMKSQSSIQMAGACNVLNLTKGADPIKGTNFQPDGGMDNFLCALDKTNHWKEGRDSFVNEISKSNASEDVLKGIRGKTFLDFTDTSVSRAKSTDSFWKYVNVNATEDGVHLPNKNTSKETFFSFYSFGFIGALTAMVYLIMFVKVGWKIFNLKLNLLLDFLQAQILMYLSAGSFQDNNGGFYTNMRKTVGIAVAYVFSTLLIPIVMDLSGLILGVIHLNHFLIQLGLVMVLLDMFYQPLISELGNLLGTGSTRFDMNNSVWKQTMSNLKNGTVGKIASNGLQKWDSKAKENKKINNDMMKNYSKKEKERVLSLGRSLNNKEEKELKNDVVLNAMKKTGKVINADKMKVDVLGTVKQDVKQKARLISLGASLGVSSVNGMFDRKESKVLKNVLKDKNLTVGQKEKIMKDIFAKKTTESTMERLGLFNTNASPETKQKNILKAKKARAQIIQEIQENGKLQDNIKNTMIFDNSSENNISTTLRSFSKGIDKAISKAQSVNASYVNTNTKTISQDLKETFNIQDNKVIKRIQTNISQNNTKELIDIISKQSNTSEQEVITKLEKTNINGILHKVQSNTSEILNETVSQEKVENAFKTINNDIKLSQKEKTLEIQRISQAHQTVVKDKITRTQYTAVNEIIKNEGVLNEQQKDKILSKTVSEKIDYKDTSKETKKQIDSADYDFTQRPDIVDGKIKFKKKEGK